MGRIWYDLWGSLGKYEVQRRGCQPHRSRSESCRCHMAWVAWNFLSRHLSLMHAMSEHTFSFLPRESGEPVRDMGWSCKERTRTRYRRWVSSFLSLDLTAVRDVEASGCLLLAEESSDRSSTPRLTHGIGTLRSSASHFLLAQGGSHRSATPRLTHGVAPQCSSPSQPKKLFQ